MDKDDRILFGVGRLAVSALLMAPAVVLGSLVGVVCLVLRAFGVL